jgi:hypothetical protein
LTSTQSFSTSITYSRYGAIILHQYRYRYYSRYSEPVKLTASMNLFNSSSRYRTFYHAVLWIRKLFFRIRIQIYNNFFRIRIRIGIRILQTCILGQPIPKFSFNGLRTFSEYITTKKNFITVKICASFHLTLVFGMLYH